MTFPFANRPVANPQEEAAMSEGQDTLFSLTLGGWPGLGAIPYYMVAYQDAMVAQEARQQIAGLLALGCRPRMTFQMTSPVAMRLEIGPVVAGVIPTDEGLVLVCPYWLAVGQGLRDFTELFLMGLGYFGHRKWALAVLQLPANGLPPPGQDALYLNLREDETFLLDLYEEDVVILGEDGQRYRPPRM
jgi:hypothetical protein